MEQKYWWILYMMNDKTIAEDVIDKHPFLYIDGLNNLIAGEYYGLVNWKTITVDEYNLWQTITTEETND